MNKILQSFLTLTVAAVSASGAAYAQDPAAPTIYGVKLYCEEGCSSGLYSLEASPGAKPKLEWADGDMMANGGAVYDGEKLYVLSYIDWYGQLFWSFLKCDIENKTYDYEMPELGVPDVGSAMTYDPTTGNAYSICIDPDDYTQFTLSTMDFTDGRKHVVGRIERMGALAADAQGRLFGISMDGSLYIIDKFSARTSLIGNTGLRPENNQSAVIDYATGVMYWNAVTPDETSLYKVDTSTAEVELITKLEPRFQFAGIFLKQKAVADGAPAPAENFSVDFDKTALSGTATFTMPNLDANGNPLNAQVGYELKCGSTTLSSGTAMPGEEVKENVEVASAGIYQWYVTVQNAAGSSEAVNVQKWVGADHPLSPTDVKAEKNEDGSLTVRWNIPERGVNGGYVDADAVRYVLIRGPYGEVIESEYEGCEFTETLQLEGVNPVMYGVHAYMDPEMVTEMVISNVVLAGDYWEPPFSENLSDPFRSLVFTIKDDNEDNCTWEYDYDFESMLCRWSLEETSDDWLFTAPVKFEADKYYSVTATVKSEGRWDSGAAQMVEQYAGHLGICLGTEASPEAMLTELLVPTEVSALTPQQLKTFNFQVPETGLYHIGLHHSGPRSIYYMLLSGLDVNQEKDSGVSIVAPEGSDVIFALTAGRLNIWNAEKVQVDVVALDGQTLYSGTDVHAELTLPAGIYVCRTPKGARKISVR